MAEHSVAERYILLGLRLGRHVDGLVDGYFGPPELKATVDAEELADPAALVDEARALVDDAAELDAEPERRRWIEEQARGLECAAELVAGAEIPWREAVRRCYAIDVEPVPEERFAEAHARLDRELPGSGDLTARLEAWHETQVVPADKLLPAFHALVEELRPRTAEIVELPEGERFEAALVSDVPWSAYNWYQGDATSRIEISTDLPMRSYFLAMLVAHEGYPGHHTEHACKEARLVRELGRVECSILMIHTPECLVSEGIAQVAVEQALGEQWVDRSAEILRPLDIPFDVEVARAAIETREALEHVGVNVACFVAEQGWTVDQAVEYYARWGLTPEHRARKAVEFTTHPVWSIYVPTYAYGDRLVRRYAAASPDGFRRLLTEQLPAADLFAAA